MGSTKRARDNRSVPWSGAPECPVHLGTPSQTSHLREFSEALRYNSPDMSGAHRTVSGALGESGSELASFGNPLCYNSPDMSGAHWTVSGAPGESDSELAGFGFPLRYNSPDMSGAHRTVR